MTNVHELRPAEPPAEGNMKCEKCGSEWFQLCVVEGNPPVVAFNQDARITAWGGAPICIECSARLMVLGEVMM